MQFEKNYFPMPNEIFSLGLSAGEIAVYAYLMHCEERETYQCHPSYNTIGKAVGMSKNTVKKNVGLLEKKRLITTEPTKVITKKGEKRNGTLLYTLLPISHGVEYRYRHQMTEIVHIARKQQIQSLLSNREKTG